MSVTLKELLNDMFGIQTFEQINKTTSDIDSTVKTILKANPNRVSFVIFNLGTAAAYISIENDVSSSKGMYIAPNGGSITVQWDRDFSLPAREWFGISSLDNQSVLILENISM